MAGIALDALLILTNSMLAVIYELIILLSSLHRQTNRGTNNINNLVHITYRRPGYESRKPDWREASMLIVMGLKCSKEEF